MYVMHVRNQVTDMRSIPGPTWPVAGLFLKIC